MPLLAHRQTDTSRLTLKVYRQHLQVAFIKFLFDLQAGNHRQKLAR